LQLFPGGDVYPAYFADPHRPANALAVQLHTGTAVDHAEGVRTWLSAGGRFGILRLAPRDAAGRSWQISVEAGFNAQYDSENRMDNVGYDGNYGFTLATTTGQGTLALKLALHHVSGHVGAAPLEASAAREAASAGERLKVLSRASAAVAPLLTRLPWELAGGGP
jgi:hypothetical protein